MSPGSAARNVRVGAGRPPSILVLAQPSPETDDLLSELVLRQDIFLMRVTSLAAAGVALDEMPIAVAIACPETPARTVTALIAEVARARPGTPVLAIRPRQAEEPPAWRARGVGVLRCPLLPEVLNRSVDLALGLRDQSRRR